MYLNFSRLSRRAHFPPSRPKSHMWTIGLSPTTKLNFLTCEFINLEIKGHFIKFFVQCYFQTCPSKTKKRKKNLMWKRIYFTIDKRTINNFINFKIYHRNVKISLDSLFKWPQRWHKICLAMHAQKFSTRKILSYVICNGSRKYLWSLRFRGN